MTKGKNKMKYILICLFLILGAGLSFAGGAGEPDGSDPFQVTDEANNVVANIDIENILGSTRVQINFTDVEEYDYLIIKKQVDGITRYYTDDAVHINTSNINNGLLSAINGIGEVEYSRYTYTFPVGTTSLDFDVNAYIVDVDDFISEEQINNWGLSQFEVDENFDFPFIDGDDSIVFIFGITSDGDCRKLGIDFPNQFFANEFITLNELYNTGTYTQKALSFMLEIMEISDQNELEAFENVVSEYFGISDLLPLAPEKSISNEERNLFLLAFQSHFDSTIDSDRLYDPGNLQLDYLDINKMAFNEIYNETDSSPYIKAYLLFNYVLHRPILANHFIQNSTSEYPYDYSQLSPVSEDTGMQIAEAALRYLTWGVESNPITQGSANNVFVQNSIYNEFQSFIYQWIRNDDETRNHTDNFLPDDHNPELLKSFDVNGNAYAGASKFTLVNTILNEDKISVSGFLNENQEFALSHIDLWASQNLAWNANTVDEVIVELNGGSIPGISDDTKNRILDKNIYYDTNFENPNTRVNLHVNRSTNDEQDIAVGYSFKSPQQISGLLIVRGLEPENGVIASSDYVNLEDPRSMSIIVNDDSIVSNVSEYGFLPFVDKKLNKYTGNKIGYLLQRGDNPNIPAQTYFDENVAYIYYIFDEPVTDVMNIRINDSTGTNYLNVAELLVFKDNPIPYITNLEFSAEVSNNSEYDFDIDGILGFSFLDGVTGQWSSPAQDQGSVPRNNPSYLFFNGNPNNRFTLTNVLQDSEYSGINSLIIDTGILVQQLALREAGNYAYQERSNIFSQQPFVTPNHIAQTLGSGLLNPISYYEVQSFMASKDLLTTPFYKTTFREGNNQGGLQRFGGNPLPYAQYGIDTPRTFAYKMNEQFYARDWYEREMEDDQFEQDRFSDLVTTGAIDGAGFIDSQNGYVSEIDISFSLGNLIEIENSTLQYGPDYYQFLNNIPTYTDQEGNARRVKPYLPGTVRLFRDIESNYQYLYSPDRTTGVDSLGLLSGTLSMVDFSGYRVLNAYNYDVPTVSRAYAEMREGEVQNAYLYPDSIDITGQDQDRYPSFYTNEIVKSQIEMPIRFTRSDFERMSVIVPTLSEIQAGDILVNFDVDGDPIVGIVVYVDLTDEQFETVNANEIIQNIYVISVRSGLNQVSIGRWGNPDGNFGGFTNTPQDFHIRRFLVLPEYGFMSPWASVASWDMLDKSIQLKLRTSYPSNQRVPDRVVYFNRDFESLIYTGNSPNEQEISNLKSDQVETLLDRLLEGKINFNTDIGHFFHRELPTTSIETRSSQSLFPEGYPMKITQLSGLRTRYDEEEFTETDNENNEIKGVRIRSYVSWHHGLDVTASTDPAQENPYLTQAQKDALMDNRVPILAPEDGRFYIAGSESANYDNSPVDLSIGQENLNNPTLFNHDNYGFMGVLVTNPNDIKNGRIYLFSHLGDDLTADQVSLINSNLYEDIIELYPTLMTEIEYSYEYIAVPGEDDGDRDFPAFDHYPNNWDTAVDIETGDALAYMANRGFSYGAHIHLMVYEYFEQAKDGAGWYQIDPLSLFDDSLYMITTVHGDEVNTYGWWSQLYGNSSDYSLAKYELLGDTDTLDPRALTINTFDGLNLDEVSQEFDGYFETASVNLYDLIKERLENDPELNFESIRAIMPPDSWDLKRIP